MTKRKVTSMMDDDMIIIVKWTYFRPAHHSRGKWDKNRISLTMDELRNLAEQYLPEYAERKNFADRLPTKRLQGEENGGGISND